MDLTFIQKLQDKIKKEINITKMTYFEWEQLKKDNNSFAKEILLNHFIIYGGEL